MSFERARLGKSFQRTQLLRAGGRIGSLLAAVLLVQACSEGSGGSNVGGTELVAPTARPQVLNAANNNNQFREGSEVFLTGKASEDYDGPLLFWRWQQTSGPAVTLVERNKTTVSFTAPDVDGNTTLGFRLTVEDSTGDEGQGTVQVTVLPAQDGDEFLSLDLIGAPKRSDRFKVVVALANNATTGAVAAPFTLSVVAHLVYPPRSAPDADCAISPTLFAGGVPTTTPGGCVVAPFGNLTPPAGISGEWAANLGPVPLPADPRVAADLAPMWWNPQFELVVPRLDVADFNQQFVVSGQRQRMLDPFNAHRARILLALTLTAPSNQGAANLILLDAENTPIEVPAAGPATVVANSQSGLPTTTVIDVADVFAAVESRESALTSQVYYDTVDPLDTRATLNAFLQNAGFAADGRGTLVAAAEDGTGEFAHAVYVNNYDLGFGRDMYTRADSLGNVYSFVTNYSTLEGAIRKIDPIVTVAMEYSGRTGPSDPDKFVKFFTYVDNGAGDSKRVSSMNFDGRGERFTPGNCVICHGGATPPSREELEPVVGCTDRESAECYRWPAMNRAGESIAGGNLGATFLPWDLESLLYADTDPAITTAPVPFDRVALAQELSRDFGDFSRSAQLAQFKKLNLAAYATYCDPSLVRDCPTASARALVEHWYGGPQLAGNFNDTGKPPAGWQNGESIVVDPLLPAVNNPATTEALYHNVFAQHCRMCHTNIADPDLRFDNYQKLAALAGPNGGTLQEMIYRKGMMPAARLTADRFWVRFGGGTSAAEQLATEFNIAPVAGRLDPRPAAVVSGLPGSVQRRDAVRLSGRNSSFANSFAWNVDFDPHPDLAANAAATSYSPKLVGFSTSDLSFEAGMPGTYTIGLGINGPNGTSAGPVQFAVPNFAPVACADPAATAPSGTTTPIAFLQNDGFTLTGAAAVGCNASALVSVQSSRDLPTTASSIYTFQNAAGQNITFNQAGEYTVPGGGTFTLATNQPCVLSTPSSAPAVGCVDDTLTYTARAAEYNDVLRYVLTDVDNESSTGTITVTVAQALQTPEPPVGNAVSDVPKALNLSISGGAVPTSGFRYRVTLDEPLNMGSLSGITLPLDTNSQNINFTYDSDDFETGHEDFTLRVTVLSDGVPTSAFSTRRYEFDVLPQAPFSTIPTEPGQKDERVADLFGTCQSCHIGTPDPMFPADANHYWFWSFDDATLFEQIRNGRRPSGSGFVPVAGGAKVILGDTVNSKILCYPATETASGRCNNVTTSHSPGSQTLDSDARAIIERWILEGALLN